MDQQAGFNQYQTPPRVVEMLLAGGGELLTFDEGRPVEPRPDFIRVPDARRLYLSGRMSLRWWYTQIEKGRLPHYRIGGAVLLKPADVEVFVADGFQPKQGEPACETTPPTPVAPSKARKQRGSAGGGLKFFG